MSVLEIKALRGILSPPPRRLLSFVDRLTTMTEALALIGLVFIVFSTIAFEVWRRRGDKEGSEAVKSIFIAVWLLIGFGVGSWLISVLLFGGLEMLHRLSERTHVPFLLLICSPVLVIFVIGVLLRRAKR